MVPTVLLIVMAWNSQWVETYVCTTSGQCNKHKDIYFRRLHHWKEIYFSNTEYSPSKSLSSSFGHVRNETDLIIVFFAVPKTGSRSVSNPFNMLYTSTDRMYQIVPAEDRVSSESLTSYLTKMPPATFVRGHFPIVNLPRNYVPISVLRDPLERFISEFNFVKHGDGQIGTERIKIHDQPEFELSIDECVRRKGLFCSRESVATYTLKFFCGYDPKCAVANEWTYKQAVDNVEDKFLMVGITEDLNSTMELIEILLPNMSKGVVSIYHEKQKLKRGTYITHRTENPSPRIRARLRKMMYWEYKFYHHVKMKFSNLKKQFGLPER